MLMKRHRISNKPFRRRLPEVFGHSSDIVIRTFHEAAWLAGPSGVLRARATQRCLSAIFDVPRAGAVMKHHLTMCNDPQQEDRLPKGVCTVCLARHREDLEDHEKCLWCGREDVCRNCLYAIHIARDDSRVQYFFDEKVFGAGRRAKRLYPERQGDNGFSDIQGCLHCILEHKLMSTREVQKRVYHGFGRIFEEVMDSGKAGRMGGYFYRELPRYSGGRYNAAGCPYWKKHENDKEEEVVVLKTIVHECTSLEFIMGKMMLQAWKRRVKAALVEYEWLFICSVLCEKHNVRTRYQGALSGFLVSGNQFGVKQHATEGRAWLKLSSGSDFSDRHKMRVVFSANNVSRGTSSLAPLSGYTAEPVMLQSSRMMDLWTNVPESHNCRNNTYVTWGCRLGNRTHHLVRNTS